MDRKRNYIAVDLGAESGRVMLASVSTDKLTLQEVFRFPNVPIEEGSSLKWNFPELISQIKIGLAQAIKKSEGQVAGIGVDSWGVDFGLLDGQGRKSPDARCEVLSVQ